MKKLHRFITEYRKINGKLEIKNPEILHQWKNVLKLKIGEEIIIVGNNNIEILAQIEEINKNSAILKILEEKINQNEPEKKVHLFLAILKKENFELAIQKAVEIGIYDITPIITDRTVKTGLNIIRLEKIVKEASELSGRSLVPKINQPLRFEDIFTKTKGQKNILFDISGKKFNSIEDKTFNIIIGPEGGFSEKEINLAKEKGVEIYSLSPLTFRAETATIIATYSSIYN